MLLAECGSHAVVGLEIGRYDVSEVHGAHRELSQIGPEMVVLVDAGITSPTSCATRLQQAGDMRKSVDKRGEVL